MIDKDILLKKLISKSKYIDNCWLFQFGKDKEGYGNLTIGGVKYRVNRLSAFIFHKLDLESSEQSNHVLECRNKNCWAPWHIYNGTHSDNMKDRVKEGGNYNTNKTHCHRGHEFTKENVYWNKGWRVCRKCRSLASKNRHKPFSERYKEL